jgi:1,4-alpha-glucan branching enzyme
MNTLQEKTGNEPFSPHHPMKLTNFYCPAPSAKNVLLTGDFTNWQPLPMETRDAGWWFIQVWMPHGHHQYRFLVDGEPTLDLSAAGTTRDDHGVPVSVIAVS